MPKIIGGRETDMPASTREKEGVKAAEQERVRMGEVSARQR
jgi:hypothetical protein